jgi:hypothetical protein
VTPRASPDTPSLEGRRPPPRRLRFHQNEPQQLCGHGNSEERQEIRLPVGRMETAVDRQVHSIVIAGSNGGMDRALEEARRQGASKAVRLHVPVPSHCPLLQPVADLLGKRMSSVNLTTPRMTYIGNVNARAIRTKEMVACDLVTNIAHGVRWHDATTVLKELGCNLFLEMPGTYSQRSRRREPPRYQIRSCRGECIVQSFASSPPRGSQYIRGRSPLLNVEEGTSRRLD